MGTRNVFMSIGSGKLHFYAQSPRDNKRNAFHHLGMQVSDLHGLHKKMEGGGYKFRQPIKSSQDGSYLMVEAPDGVLIELFEPGPDRKTILGDYYF